MNPSDFNSDLIDKIFVEVQDGLQSSQLTAYCQILAGIFALSYIGNIFWKTWGKGQEIHIVDFAKPFVVLICIMNFSLVTGLLDNLIGMPLNKATTALVESNQGDILQKLSKHISEPIFENLSIEDMIFHPVDSTKKMYDGVTKIPRLVFSTVLVLLSQVLCVLAKTCMIGYSYLLRILLTVFGPIAFALCLIPYFSDNIKNWVGKYIGALLYLPICNIILYTTQCFASAMFQISSSDQLSYHLENATKLKYDLLSTDMGIAIMFLVSACAYFTVPSLAGFILNMAQSSGNIGIQGAVMSTSKLAGQGAAAVATGGASLSTLGDGGILQSLGQIIQSKKDNSSNIENGNNNEPTNSGAKGDG